MRDSLQTRVLEQLEQAPRRRAIGFYDGASCRWLNRGQLHRQATQAAVRLQDEGLSPGQPLILRLRSEEHVPPILLGALLAGAVPLLLAPASFSPQAPGRLSLLRRVVRRTGAKLVVTSDAAGDVTLSGTARRISVPSLLPPGRSAGDSWRAPQFASRAALQMTSGTTAAARICVWRQRSVLAALDGMRAVVEPNRETRFFNWTPLFHDLGLVNNLLFCLVHGVPLVLANPQQFVAAPELWLRGMSATRATTTWAPNFGFALTTARARERALEGVRLGRVEAFWNAAERVHLQTMEEFWRRFSHLGLRRRALRTSYGCAENVGGATFSGPGGALSADRIDRHQLYSRRRARRLAADDERAAEPIVGSGRAAPGVIPRIVSRTGRTLPEAHVGEIVLDTQSCMEGYLGDAAATRRVLRWGGLRTGDLGYLRDGELFWVGRIRERITLRGAKLDPSALEPALLAVEGLRAGCFVAFGVDNARTGTQDLVIVSEIRRPLRRALSRIEMAVRREVFDRFAVKVADVTLVDTGALTKTSSGKRRHSYYRKLYASGELESVRLGRSQRGRARGAGQ